MKEFFGGSQLSQFMDQTNPLAELTSKRRLRRLGPGGLSRERAGFDVRDVHHSHYGRICPIETPEGPNIGLIGSLATYGRINEYGFIETPYRASSARPAGTTRTSRPRSPMPMSPPRRARSSCARAILHRRGGRRAEEAEGCAFPVARASPKTSTTSTPRKKSSYVVAQANAALDADRRFIDERVPPASATSSRRRGPTRSSTWTCQPQQVVSVATALIPFLEHDDANRALMGSNMQRQAVPLLEPEAPIVGTGMEARAALDSGQVVVAAGAVSLPA